MDRRRSRVREAVGFDLAALDVPVTIWQGDRDLMVPSAHGTWLAASIPRAVAKPALGHGRIVARSMSADFGYPKQKNAGSGKRSSPAQNPASIDCAFMATRMMRSASGGGAAARPE